MSAWRWVAAVGVAGMAGTVAWADGCFVAPERVMGRGGVASTEQKGVIIELADGREVLLLQTTYHGPSEEFAWIIPVPGEPGDDDVFLASTDFIDAALDATAPVVRTHISERAGRGGLEEGMTAAEAPGMAGEAGTVTLHRRMEVGEFEVSVLSATGTVVLLNWLDENGYRTPEGHGEIFQAYVDRAWYFVALRMLPSAVSEKPRMDDVAPIGIRFATDRLVYPLLISRLSSRERTALLLVLMTQEAVMCEQIGTARLPLKESFGPGTCYATIRRELCEKTGALVCEYSGTGDLAYTDLWYIEDQWRPEGAPQFHKMQLKRLWGVLGLAQLEDLSFARQVEGQQVRLMIERRGAVYLTARERLSRFAARMRPAWRGYHMSGARLVVSAGVLGVVGTFAFLGAALLSAAGVKLTPWQITGDAVLALLVCPLLYALGALAAGLLVLVLIAGIVRLLRGLVKIRSAEPSETALTPAAALHWAVAFAGLVGVTTILICGLEYGDPLGNAIAGQEGWLVTLLIAIPCLGWSALAFRGLATRLSGDEAARVRARFYVLTAPIFCAAMLLATTRVAGWWEVLLVGPARAMGMAATAMVALAAVSGLVAFALIGGFAGGRARAAAQPLAQALLVTALLGVLIYGGAMAAAHAGMGITRSSGVQALDRALTSLDDALERFTKDTGCYPAALEDLTARTAPAKGLDSSGNGVPVGGAFGGPYLPRLPRDPLTGRSDTWVYEVTGTPMIDSGGYSIRLERAKLGTREQPWGGSHGREPEEYYGEDVTYPLASEARAVRSGEGVFSAALPAGGLVQVEVAEKRVWVGQRREHLSGSFSVSPGGGELLCWEWVRGGARIGMFPVEGGKVRGMTPGPWGVDVDSVAWHPHRRLWLAVAREVTAGDWDSHRWYGMQGARESLHRVYVLDGRSMPRQAPGSEHAIDAYWSPDGDSILAIIAEDAPWYQPRPGKLVRIGLDGVTEELADAYYLGDSFVSNRWGAAAATPAGDIAYLDPEGGRQTLRKPEADLAPLDVWVGEGAVVAAYCPRARHGHYDRESQASAKVCLYPDGASKPKVIAECEWVRSYLAISKIVGWEPTQRAVVLYHASGDVYVLRPEEPRVENLSRPGLVGGLGHILRVSDVKW